MHISLDWSGAEKKTSFWTGIVTAPMAPPLQTLKVGQTATTTVSPRYPPTPAYRLVKERFPDADIVSIRFQGPDAPSWKRGPRSIPGRGPRDTYG